MPEKIIKVKVTPRSSVSQIQENLLGELKVKVKAPPVGGQANKEVIELLAEYYGASKGQIEIVKGLTSKTKLIKLKTRQ